MASTRGQLKGDKSTDNCHQFSWTFYSIPRIFGVTMTWAPICYPLSFYLDPWTVEVHGTVWHSFLSGLSLLFSLCTDGKRGRKQLVARQSYEPIGQMRSESENREGYLRLLALFAPSTICISHSLSLPPLFGVHYRMPSALWLRARILCSFAN